MRNREPEFSSDNLPVRSTYGDPSGGFESRIRRWLLIVVAAIPFVWSPLWCTAVEPITQLKPDETLVLFPGVCFQNEGDKSWILRIQGCVYEPAKSSYSLMFLEKLLSAYGVKLTEQERQSLRERARFFMVDNESRKSVFVRCAGVPLMVGKTRANGHFSEEVRLEAPTAEAFGVSRSNVCYLEALLPKGRKPVVAQVAVLRSNDWVVISDIDDTIRLSMVTHPQALLRSTFLEPFKPIEGMNKLYASWAKDAEAHFVYVSGSPWQLYEPLSQFVQAQGFPSGNFYLKQFRLKDRSLTSLWADPEQYKVGAIGSLLKRLQEQKVVLVGDSGEKDPEAYGVLARKYPDRIARIFIRNTTAEQTNSPRFENAFAGVPPSKWALFREPSVLTNALPLGNP